MTHSPTSTQPFTLSRDDVRPGAFQVELRRGATLRVDAWPAGADLRCTRGTLLVTRLEDISDHVLEAGDVLHVTPSDRAVAWALTDATFSIRLNPATEDCPAGTVLAERARWLGRRARSIQLGRLIAGPALLAAWLATTVAFVVTCW